MMKISTNIQAKIDALQGKTTGAPSKTSHAKPLQSTTGLGGGAPKTELKGGHRPQTAAFQPVPMQTGTNPMAAPNPFAQFAEMFANVDVGKLGQAVAAASSSASGHTSAPGGDIANAAVKHSGEQAHASEGAMKEMMGQVGQQALLGIKMQNEMAGIEMVKDMAKAVAKGIKSTGKGVSDLAS